MKRLLRVLGPFVCLLCLASVAHAQTGEIRGAVKDPTGAVIAGAKITITEQGTGAQRSTSSREDGSFEFPAVAVAVYSVEVEAPGFKKYVQKDLAVDIGHVVVVNVTMQVGQSSTTVTVEASAVQVETTSTQIGAVVDSRSVVQLPLNTRDTFQLLQIQPGVQSQLGDALFYGSDKAGVVTVNGARGRSNNYTINGGDSNDLFANLPGVQPSPDSVEEFRVLSDTFDAEYGRNSGAVVNVVTKSGTNDWHGDVFEFFRNDVLNAKGFYDLTKPEFRQNQFGGTLGGPIKKDKHFFFVSYEGRRIVQGVSTVPVSLPTPAELGTANPPPANCKALGITCGDFSSGPGFMGSPTVTVANILNIRDGGACATDIGLLGGGPGLTAALAGNTAYWNLPPPTPPPPAPPPPPGPPIFPTNQIPTACFDPVAMNLYHQFVPNANITTNGQNQFVGVPNMNDFGDQVSARYDWNATSTQKVSVYYYYNTANVLDPFAFFEAAGANLGNFPGVTYTRTQQLNVSHTWTLGSTGVNEFHFTYFREAQPSFDTPTKTNPVTSSCTGVAIMPDCFTGQTDTPLVAPVYNAMGTLTGTTPVTPSPGQSLGITPGLSSNFEGVPYISVTGGFSIGNNFEGQLPQLGNTYQWSEGYTKVAGKHTMKFGGDYRYQQFDQHYYYNVNGSFTFSPTASGSTIGFLDAYPNYLLGLPTSYSQGSAQQELVRIHSVSLYAQDSWKLKPTVTLNYGLRWELNTPLDDIGHKVETFRPGQFSTVYPCFLTPTEQTTFGTTDCNTAGVTPVGEVVPGDKGVPNGLTQTYYKSFGPRIGLAWSPGWSEGWLKALTGGQGKTSVRMGYGIFYNPIEQLVLAQFSAEPPFGGSSSISDGLFQTPFVTQSGSVVPNGYNGILNPTPDTAQDWARFRPILLFGEFPKLERSQYGEQFNLTIQRQLPGDMLFQVAYVGSQGHRLLATYDLNPGNPLTCLDISALNQTNPKLFPNCGPFGADSSYSFILPAGDTFHLPYMPGGPNGTNIPCSPVHPAAGCIITGAPVVGTPITLVGIRPYSSPLCNPLTGASCPADGTPVFSNIFTQSNAGFSNYNSLQLLVEKKFSHGLQFQAAYTYSKTIDNASSFENALNPYDLNGTRGLSLFDARHRFVLSYYWELPVPKYQGTKGKFLNGWAMSGIYTLQSGFPIRITDSNDTELFTSAAFEAAGEPSLVGPFATLNPHKTGGQVFNTAVFQDPTTDPALMLANGGVFPYVGNAPRSICCGPGINNFDTSFQKFTPIGERVNLEFRADIFNIWNHAQFFDVDGNFSDLGGTFGKALMVRQPRLVQFALKVHF